MELDYIAMGQRIKTLRKKLDLTQDEFAKRIKRTRSNVAGVEIGSYKITPNFIRDICITFNANKEWLTSGTGEMFNELNLDRMIQLKLFELEPESIKKVMILALLDLNDDVWGVLEQKMVHMIDMMAK